MEKFLYENMTTLAVGLILSIAFYGAFKAGQLFERTAFSDHELSLEILKQKTESLVQSLLITYTERNGNFQLRQGITVKEIVENAFLYKENLKEQILGLNQIYLDLMSNGIHSSDFICILETYGL